MTDVYDGGRLTDELRSLVSDAEALLRASTGMDGPEIRERVETTLKDLRARLASVEEQVGAKARDVDSYVRDNPWQAVAIAGGVALLLGLIMGRK